LCERKHASVFSATGVHAKKSWPRFLTDLEIDRATNMGARCSSQSGIDPVFVPNFEVKRFVGKRRHGFEKASDVIVGTKRDAIDLSSVFICVIVPKHPPAPDFRERRRCQSPRIAASQGLPCRPRLRSTVSALEAGARIGPPTPSFRTRYRLTVVRVLAHLRGCHAELLVESAVERCDAFKAALKGYVCDWHG